MTAPEDLDGLVEGHLRGELNAEQKQRLAGLLDGDADAQRCFVEQVELVSGLMRIARGNAVADEAQAPPRSVERPWFGSRTFRTAAVWCGVLAIGWATMAVRRARTPDSEAGASRALAVRVDAADARFKSRPDTAPRDFPPGRYELERGVVHLRLNGGTDLLVRGPAQFELQDARHVRLEHGIVRIMVSPQARGLIVTTPSGIYQDVGTEFGLQVDARTGEQTLHVFDGQVNVLSADRSAIAEVRQGQSVRYRGGKVVAAADVRPDLFPAPGAVGRLRWEAFHAARLEDPGLIAYFPFVRQGDAALLKNFAPGRGVGDARIVGARWVSGRWPGKQALLFDRPGDYAEFDVDGSFEAMTVCAWVKTDRYDHVVQAILNSNGWEDGDVHFQLKRGGVPYGDWRGERPQNLHLESFGPRLSTGQWTHVALVASMPKNRLMTYVNGVQASQRTLQTSGTLRPGRCRMGNWLATGDFAPVRTLQGQLGELAIWNQALSVSEIRAEVKRGQPDFVWARQKPVSP